MIDIFSFDDNCIDVIRCFFKMICWLDAYGVRGKNMEYVIFTDESNITDSRFQSLCAFSLPKNYVSEFTTIMKQILVSSDVSEFKWQKLKTAKYYFCAEKIIDTIFKHLKQYNIRIDTVVWDTHDSRHTVQSRDDIANYERMFFHLLTNAMKRREKGAVWDVMPDQRNGIDWGTIHSCIASIGSRCEVDHSLFGLFFSDSHYRIRSFIEQDSSLQVPVQVADLFSGLAIFSKSSFSAYSTWKESQVPSLFDSQEVKLTNGEKFRFKLLKKFDEKCKKEKLGVSLKTKQCLSTFNPENPINFWHYIPQHESDKAPVRS
ncbi:MAG: DUF3800 domain-containing protein [Candidatus Dojkabacteria bacterium]